MQRQVSVDCEKCGRKDEIHNVSGSDVIPEVPATYVSWALKNHRDFYHQSTVPDPNRPKDDLEGVTGRLLDFTHGKDHNA